MSRNSYVVKSRRQIRDSYIEEDSEQIDFEVKLRKAMACIFRFRSRKVASFFSQWKYKSYYMKQMASGIKKERAFTFNRK